VLAILLLFNFVRAGQQVVAGLDPNFTVNAWGGPGYLGAMLARYLDGVYLFYLEALLMDLVLLKHASMTGTGHRNYAASSDRLWSAPRPRLGS
jgi:hypothetical protein